MNEDDLRIKIYEELGLEVGSLTSEGGNDWERAKKEVLAEYRSKQLEKAPSSKKTDYINMDKSNPNFTKVINSNSVKLQQYHTLIAKRQDLINHDIMLLIKNGSKETIMNLVRYQKLTSEQIDYIIPNSVYLVKELLIEKQQLSESNKKNLLIQMKINESIYKSSINRLEEN